MNYYVDKFVRGFLKHTYGSDDKLQYEDPTFLTFRLLFDYSPLYDNDEVQQSLLLGEYENESATMYLRRKKYLDKAEALKEFIWLLQRIENEFPWFFKSITGVGNLWKWGYPVNNKIDYSPVQLTIDCLESLDFRMTVLADLYRKASFDRLYGRDLLIDKKRFNCRLIVGEARQLKTFVENIDTPKYNWLNHFNAIVFNLYDCEFDFSDSFGDMISAEKPNMANQKIKINVGRVKESNNYKSLDYILGDMRRDIVIRKGGSGASYRDDIEVTDFKNIVNPVLDYFNDYQNVNDIAGLLNYEISSTSDDFKYQMSVNDFVLKTITTKSLDTIDVQNIDYNDKFSDLDVQDVSIKKDFDSIDIGDVNINKDFFEPDIQIPKINNKIDDFDISNIKINDKLNDVDLVTPTPNDKLNDVDLVTPNLNKIFDEITLLHPDKNIDITSIENNDIIVNSDLDNIQFSNNVVNKVIDNIDIKDVNINTKIDDIVMSILDTNKNIDSVSMSDITINKNISNVNIEKIQQKKEFSEISFSNVDINTSINNVLFDKTLIVSDISEDKLNFENVIVNKTVTEDKPSEDDIYKYTDS